MHKAAKAYLTTKVTTTSQGDILIMLYDAAIKNLKQAKVKIEEKDFAAKGILISKAMDIINELSGSLNAEKGGSLAENLHNIYFYCSTRLLTANLKMDTELLDEVIRILGGIRSAFAEIIPGHAPQPGANTAPGAQPGAPAVPPAPGMAPQAQAAQAPASGQAPAPTPAQGRPLMPTAAPPLTPPAAAKTAAQPAGNGPVAGPPPAQPMPGTPAPAKKPAPVTPLHPAQSAPAGPVRRAVAAYGNAR